MVRTRVDPAGFDWEAASQFWQPYALGQKVIAMVGVYCDESHDDHTYTLAGWLTSDPAGWKFFASAWREMLREFPVQCFHASELVNRDFDENSRYKGWTFGDEKRFFTRAVDVVCDRDACGWLVPVGCSVSLADKERWVATPDTAWKLLFVRLFMAVLEKFPAQNGFTFIFDNKPEVKQYVDRFYQPAKKAINDVYPGKIHGDVVGFADDEEAGFEGLQAADLLAYEWRRRITERVTNPEKRMRTSWQRIRNGRRTDALRHYNAQAVNQIVSSGQHFVVAMMSAPFTED